MGDHNHSHAHGAHHHHHHDNDVTDYMAAVTEYRKSFASKADVMAQAPDPAVREMLAYMESNGYESLRQTKQTIQGKTVVIFGP